MGHILSSKCYLSKACIHSYTVQLSLFILTLKMLAVSCGVAIQAIIIFRISFSGPEYFVKRICVTILLKVVDDDTQKRSLKMVIQAGDPNCLQSKMLTSKSCSIEHSI